MNGSLIKSKVAIFSFIRSTFCSTIAMNLHKNPMRVGVLALYERQRKQRAETQKPFGPDLMFIKSLKSTLYSLSPNEVGHLEPQRFTVRDERRPSSSRLECHPL